MRDKKIVKLTLAGMFAALAFCCFSYLRIEVPMGLGLTGKIYIGHAFLILSALVVGARYGALSGAVGLTLADVLAGYTTSAPPTFAAKFILGWSVAFLAHRVLHLHEAAPDRRDRIVVAAAVGGSIVNVLTEPLIRFSFKYFVLGYAYQVAYVSALNCAVSMALSAIPSVFVAVLLYKVLQRGVLRNRDQERG
ncbi:MAG: ECF transporter S component [Acidaminococcaceae bacterium]|nr:ECF transporter S component [Acidaminococcaceae bacterium]HAY61164.1 ECF transporter S component [Acidaminococcaceae bacterium]HCJ91490.1 ECF transporter S component [Acidaminococcaceae bacterium]